MSQHKKEEHLGKVRGSVLHALVTYLKKTQHNNVSLSGESVACQIAVR